MPHKLQSAIFVIIVAFVTIFISNSVIQNGFHVTQKSILKRQMCKSNNYIRTSSNIFSLRGGKNKKKRKIAKNKKKPLKAKESSVETEILDDSFNDVEQLNMHDNRGRKALNYFTDFISKTPPITQFYLVSSVFLTFMSCLFNKNNWPKILEFDWNSILTKFQIWRLFTPFLFMGKLDIYYPLTLQFIWQHMSQLERLNYNKPEVFLLMLFFGGFVLIMIYSLLGISTKFLGHNIGAYLVYIWARVFEGLDVNFMDLFPLKAELLPWFFCLQSLVLDGQIPYADLLGILAGHCYYYLNRKKLLKAPNFVKEWFATESMKELYAKYKEEFE